MVSQHWRVNDEFTVDTPDGGPDSSEIIPANTELHDVEQVAGAAPDRESISTQIAQFHYNGRRCTCRLPWLRAHATEI